MNKPVQTIFIFLALALSFILSACDSIIPDTWYDPVYFGESDDLGKTVGGSGTGREAKSPTGHFSIY